MKKKFLFLTLLLPYISTISGCARAYTVTIINNNEDMGEIVGGGKFKANTQIIIDATPFDGYTFVNWTNEYGSKVSSRESYKIIVESNITLYANFDYEDYGVTVESVQGYIEGNGNHKYMSDVSLKATALPGYKFISWNDENGNIVSRDNPYNFAMPSEDLKFKAVYEEYTIEFGQYPKTKISNSELISELSKIDSRNERGYIEYNGKEYIDCASSDFGAPEEYLGTFSDGTAVEKNTLYYFEVQPITWKVLQETDDAYLVWTKDAIDCRIYNNYSQGEMSCYYETSAIREYLNDDFISTVFSEEEVSKIKETVLSDPMEGCSYAGEVYTTELKDKVYLPSRAEMWKYHRYDASIGFSENYDYWFVLTDFAFIKTWPEAYNGRNIAKYVLTRTPYQDSTLGFVDSWITAICPLGQDWVGVSASWANLVPMMWISK